MRRLLALLLSLLWASPAFALVIALRGDGAYGANTGATTATATLNAPSGMAAGDCVLAFVSIRSNSSSVSGTIATPSGMTKTNDVQGGVSTAWLHEYLFTKVATSGDVTAGTFAFVGTAVGSTAISVDGDVRTYYNTNASNCINASVVGPSSSGTTIVINTLSGVETFVSGELYVLGAVNVYLDVGAPTGTSPLSPSNIYNPCFTSCGGAYNGYAVADSVPSSVPLAETISGYPSNSGRVAIGVTILPISGGATPCQAGSILLQGAGC